MGDKNWWFNRAGAVAPVSNPGSATPNYGLTMDVATAPWDGDTNFQALAESLQGALTKVAAPYLMMQSQGATMQDETLWDKATDAASWVGDQAAGVAGLANEGLNKLGLDAMLDDETEAEEAALREEADKKGLTGWERYQFLAKGSLGNQMQDIADEGTASGKALKAMDTATKYASAGFLFASLNEEDMGGFLTGQHWSEAKAMAFEGNWSPGEAFVQMFYDNEILDDEERLEKLREHNTLFNVSALGFNVIAAWKADPTVLIGKGAGKIGDISAGRLATDGRAAEVQRDILAQPSRQDAVASARTYTGMADRVRANRALSLYDKAQELRTAAQTMGFEEFKNLSPFKNSASGVVMAKLMKDTAHSDNDWNLVFRASIGDASAVDELAAKRGELASKISAIEARDLPKMEGDLGLIENRLQAIRSENPRLAELREKFGRDERAAVTGYLDWSERTTREAIESKRAELASFESHESWAQRALPGLDLEADTLNNRVANSVFGNLEQVGVGMNPLQQAGRATRASLYELGGKVTTWRHDDYSPVARAFRAPAKPFLKRTGVVNLNDVDEGGTAVNSYLDQIAYITGKNDQTVRDGVLERWAGSVSDVERKDIVDELERQGIAMLGRKYGLNAGLMDRVARDLQSRRGSAWSKMSDRTMYTAVKGQNGKRLDMFEYVDDHGNKQSIRMPMDPSELPNWRPLTNLTDLDHSLRMNKDLFAELGKAEELGLATARHSENVYNAVGETLNAFWKPLALISLRWPSRVVADESFRIMLMMGVLPHMKAWGEGARATVHNQGVVRAREWWQGREIRTKSLAEDSLRAMSHDFDPWDTRAATNPTGATPARVLDFDQIDQKRYARLNAATSERWGHLRSLDYYKSGSKAGPVDDSAFLWHGAKTDLSGGLRPRGEVASETATYVGDGFYTTTSRASAERYATRDGSTLYRTPKPADSDVFDLNQKITPEQRQALIDAFDEYVAGFDVSPDLKRKLAKVRREFHDGNNMSIGTFKHAYESAVSQGLDFPAEGLEVTRWITRHIEEKYGAKVLKHRSSPDDDFAEDVFIWLRPEELKLARADEPAKPKVIKPKWAQQWDDRLAAAEKSDTRGFFFDPITGKAANKGFAVSVYPGKLKTFEKKPTARETNYWIEKNSDLLAIKGNRVAVWLDKDTGRWHLDVTKVARNREDAMRLATEAEAPEFFDITDGFTRYMADEDPYGHRAGASVFETGGFDAVTTESIKVPDAYVSEPKRGVGFGKRKWRTSDGREVEGEAVFGLDKRDPNIYYSTTSSQGAFQGLLGGHTRGLGQNRAKRTTRGYKVFQPGDDVNSPEALEWAEAWTYYVNNHIRMSPIWKRMLNGQSDEQIEKWLMSASGRDIRKRMGPRGHDVHKWVTEMRAIYDHTMPTAEARAAALAGDIDPKKVDDIIPLDRRNEVHGQDIELTAGVHDAQKAWFSFVDKAYTMLGSMPTDALVRHPFAANVYDLRLKNYLATVPADQITNKVLAAAEASARAFAVKQTRRLLYNIADEMEGVHMLRFLSPFFQAQLEVMERYSYIWTRKPETFARTMLALHETHAIDTPWFETVDSEGNPTEESHHDNQVVLQVTPFMRKIADRIPGLKGALENAGTLKIPTASMNLILQGEKWYLPSVGPLVTIPASEFYFRERPWKSESEVYKWLFPFGTPDGGGAVTRTAKGMMPAYMRRAFTAMTADFDDSAFANRANIIYQDMLLAYQQGKRDKPPTENEALEATKNEYMLRAFSSFTMPVPVTPQSPHQFWLDQGRAYRDKYGIDASEKFYEDFGADAFAYFVESSKSTNGLAPTSAQAKGYVKNKKLVDQAPDLAGILAGPFGYSGEFNDAVYQWQLETRRSPLSKTNMREIKDPAERIKDVQIDRGWIEYGKLSSALDAELRRRGLTSVENNGAEDLKFWRDQEVEGIIARNPAFSDAYQSRDQSMGDWLQQAYKVSFDKALDGRTDIEGLRAYLISRAKMQDALQQRQAAGMVESDSLSATDNADLKQAWDSYTRELVSRNLLFAEIFHRYLENDDLSVYIAPEG